MYQLGGSGSREFTHQLGAVHFHRAGAEVDLAGDAFAGLALDQQGGDFPFARGQLGGDGAFFADVLERPDAGTERLLGLHRMAGDVAPEQFATGAAHDALVRIAALGVHDRNDAVAGAQEFVHRRIQRQEGQAFELEAGIAEHRRQRVVAALDDAIFRYAHAHRRVQENGFVIDDGGGVHGESGR